MNGQIIIAGLKARPVRSTVSVLAVALEVVLILIVVGLTEGMVAESGKRTAGMGAEITVQPPNSGIFLALSSNTMPVSLAGKIKQLPGVKAVAPIQLQINSSAGVETVFGIDPESFDAVTGGFEWRKGRLLKGPDEIVVDDVWPKAKEATVGDTVELFNHRFKVVGIVQPGLGARVYLSMEGSSAVSGQTDRIAIFYVKVTDPALTQKVMAEIHSLVPGYTLRDVNEWASLFTPSNIPGLGAFIQAVVFVAVCIGVLVIFLSMYTTITERTREIGILRSMGASRAFIVARIFQETVTICAVGVVLGIGLSFVVRALFEYVFPTLPVYITVEWTTKAALFAVMSGVIGSLYPASKAANQDPVDALAYE
jgi:putative ABC transport system permease protein